MDGLPFLNSHGYIMLLRFYQTKSTLPKYFNNINKNIFKNLNFEMKLFCSLTLGEIYLGLFKTIYVIILMLITFLCNFVRQLHIYIYKP